MQTIIRRTNGNGGKTHRGRISNRHLQRSTFQKKGHPGNRLYRTGFLKQPLKEVSAQSSIYGSTFKVYFSEKNYKNLLECAVHYAGLLGKTIEMPTGKIHERVSMLYRYFAGIIPEDQGLNLDVDDGRLMWIIYHEHNWKDHTFYWMPIKFITLLSGQIKEIAMSFMNRFIHRNGLQRFRQSYEYEYFFESASESLANNDYSEDERKYLDELIDSYFCGEIAGFLDEVYDHKPIDVAAELEKYKTSDPLELKLIDCFRKGLPFISGGSIMSYDYDQYGSGIYDYNDDEPVTLDRIVRYVYELDDFITNEIEYMANHQFENTYAVEPTSFKVLYPDSKLFVPDDYPERFADWFLEMVILTNEITNHE